MQEKKEEKEKGLEDLYEDAKSYVETSVEYTRLVIVEKMSKVFADLVTNVAVVACFILAFLFATITLALYLSEVLGSYTQGFGYVAIIYVLLALIVYLTKDKYIEKAIVNYSIRRYFRKIAEDDEED